jgi:hypothetical protein
MLLRPTLQRYTVRYVTTEPAVARQHGVMQSDVLPDCNQNTPVRALWCALAALVLILRRRPRVIVTTGSAPGFFCVLAGRLIGARSLWIDSVANGEELSISGRLSRAIGVECWTQWEYLVAPRGPHYHGSVL